MVYISANYTTKAKDGEILEGGMRIYGDHGRLTKFFKLLDIETVLKSQLTSPKAETLVTGT